MLPEDMSELLEMGAELKLEAANGTRIPYNGWVEINFKLLDDTTSEISVLLLVAREEVSLPIFGYNVIELFIKGSKPDQVLLAVTKSFAKTNASALIAFITGDASDSLCVVKTSKKDTVIPKGADSRCHLPCKYWTSRTQKPSAI